MIEPILQFILSASVIVLAGIFLARSSDTIAELTNMGRLIAGSILLAGATSLPEFMVDVSAIRKGMPDLAVGDLMGSSLMNLLILAVADLLHRNPRKMFSRAGAQHALSAAMSINVTALAAIAIFLSPQLEDIDIGEISIGVLAIGVAYIFGLRLLYCDQRAVSQGSVDPSSQGGSKRPLIRASIIYLLSALAIFVAAPFLAEAAGKIADLTGLGKTFVGSTLVAFCTSLPEVVSTIAAVRMGAFDLAVGNIFGSNSFNMILLIPLDWFHPGNLLAATAETHALTALAIILATSIAVMGQLYHEEKRKVIIEPDALAVIGVVIAAISVLYWVGGA